VTAQLMRVEIVREQAEAPPPEMPEMEAQHIRCDDRRG
jgi:preprotein translocase subunit SecA